MCHTIVLVCSGLCLELLNLRGGLACRRGRCVRVSCRLRGVDRLRNVMQLPRVRDSWDSEANSERVIGSCSRLSIDCDRCGSAVGIARLSCDAVVCRPFCSTYLR